jgi:DNA-binding NarL/FixJ family response regulator
MTRPSVLLADDHAIFIDGLGHLLRQHFEIVGTALNGHALIEMARDKQPDVIVADISMPHLNGIDAARILRDDLPSLKFVFLTMHAELPLVEEAFQLGASGFVLKICDVSELVTAIQSVAKGGTYITPLLAGQLISALVAIDSREPHRTSPGSRQREVLRLLAEGKTMKKVADPMGISPRTAESHKYEVMRQLGIQSTAALVRYAIRSKLV